MVIEAFRFGLIVINGRRCTSDFKIYPDGAIVEPWVRKSGHKLSRDDIRDILDRKPDAIVSGTGINGLMVPDENLKEFLFEQGIQFFPEPNRKAVDIFNELSVRLRIAACFHLTC